MRAALSLSFMRVGRRITLDSHLFGSFPTRASAEYEVQMPRSTTELPIVVRDVEGVHGLHSEILREQVIHEHVFHSFALSSPIKL
jgi:hypothetical protein